MRIVVTGSSSGIGEFIADSLEQSGNEVCRIARSAQPGFSFQCDVSECQQLDEAARNVAEKWHAVNALVCCAGIQEPIGPTMEIAPALWRNNIGVNLDGTFFAIRSFYRLLKQSQRRAKIVCFSGGGATGPRPNFGAYAVAKAGVVRLVETLAAEWARDPIDINAIAPGAIYTRMTEQVLQQGAAAAGQREFESAQKLAKDNSEKLEKMFGLVSFLLSEKSNGISGRLISAPWDPWEKLDEHVEELSQSDIYCLRRIVPEDRGKKWS